MSNNNPPTPEPLRRSFLQWLRMRNLSPRTIEQWEYTIRRFNLWCAERDITCVTQVTPQLMAAYRRYLFHYRNAKTGKPLKFATQTSYLMSLRRWFVWLHEENFVPENPAEKLQLPKEEKRLPTGSLTADEVESVLNAVDVTTELGIRNRAILETFYSTGIRCGELTALQVYDLQAERGILTIHQGKGGKDRVVPIGERALKWVKKYEADIRPKLAEKTNTSVLFLSQRGRPFGRNNMSLLVKGYLNAAGIQKRGSCHLVRHSAATLMMENGADLRSLQEFLGHERLNTTQIYTHVSIKRLQDVHRKTHPAEPDQKPDSDKQE
jgi:integrase/recombinase XerD